MSKDNTPLTLVKWHFESLKAELEQANKATDQQVKLAADRQQQLEQANEARDQQVKLAADRQRQLEQLNQEEQFKKQVTNKEYIKVETQIELIKDVLLRGSSMGL